jgi:hypothetical protein
MALPRDEVAVAIAVEIRERERVGLVHHEGGAWTGRRLRHDRALLEGSRRGLCEPREAPSARGERRDHVAVAVAIDVGHVHLRPAASEGGVVRVLRPRQVRHDVLHLVLLAPLHEYSLPEDVADAGAQPTRAVDDEQALALRVETSSHEVLEQALARDGVLGRPLPEPEHVLRPPGIDAQCDEHHVLREVEGGRHAAARRPDDAAGSSNPC